MSDVAVELDFAEIAQLSARLPGLPARVETDAATILRRVVLEGEARAKRRARKDTGHGRRSITHRVDRTANAIIGRFGTNVGYMEVMEKGRRPGAALPPRGALLGWMRRHGIPAANEYVIRRAIARKGIPGDHVFRDTLADVTPLARRSLADLRDGVIATLRRAGQ
jgi:hypothetical protein